MIGRCPNCGIELNKPPFTERERNEALIVLIYREIVESGAKLNKIEELGYCEVCKASKDDLENQKSLPD